MEKKPFIGQMDRPIQLVEKVVSRTSTGSEETTETVLCSPYAMMDDLSGNKDIEGKVIHLVNRAYTIRYRSEIKAKQQSLVLVDNGTRYFIENIMEIGRKDRLKLIVRLYE